MDVQLTGLHLIGIRVLHSRTQQADGGLPLLRVGQREQQQLVPASQDGRPIGTAISGKWQRQQQWQAILLCWMLAPRMAGLNLQARQDWQCWQPAMHPGSP